MKRKFYTITDRKTLIKYLYWEYGAHSVILNLKRAKKINGLYIVNDSCFNEGKRKRDALSLASRVSKAAAYIDGKLHKNGFGSFVDVINA
jgi:hypothetical protein